MISLHYVFARVGERAHADVLPLCCYHHVTRLEAEKLTQYPNMIPIHAKEIWRQSAMEDSQRYRDRVVI
ncbi:Ref family recombination enhancement nuclease [Vibrio alginolyticus]|nr:hypothetical protein [Vibrio alginolyticus]EKP4442003.1 hypothetical protein [Vibrio alginolyticus]